MTGKIKKSLGIPLIPIALLFLFDPSYSLLDALPDAIGYLILCIALINLSDIIPQMTEAFRGFRRAAIVSLFRVIATVVIFYYFDGNEQTLISLVAVFVFAVLDLVVLLPTYKTLFEGLLYLGTYHNGTYVYTSKKQGDRNITEKLSFFTAVFLIIKNALWVIPELSCLMSDQAYEFVNVLRMFALVILVPIALVWLIRMIRYFRGISRDKYFIESLSALYRDKTSGVEGYFTNRTVAVCISIMSFALVLSHDIYIDSVNVICDAWMYALILVAACIMIRFSKKYVVLAAVSVFGILSSCLKDMAVQYFYSRYEATDVIRDIHAYNAHKFMLISYAFDAVVFCLVLVLTLVLLKNTYSERCTQFQSDQKRYIAGAIITVTLCVICSAFAIFSIYAIPMYEKGFIYSASGVFSGVLSIVFIVSAWYFISNIASAIRQSTKTDLY